MLEPESEPPYKHSNTVSKPSQIKQPESKAFFSDFNEIKPDIAHSMEAVSQGQNVSLADEVADNQELQN